MRIPFLFWNLRQKPLQSLIAQLAREHEVALIALVECSVDSQVIIDALDAAGMPGFTCPVGPTNEVGDIKLFMRIPNASLVSVYDDANNHVTIRRMVFEHAPELLLVVVHSQSKRDWDEANQVQGATQLASRIMDSEARYNHHRTVLVGDLNMDPFEKGVVGWAGLHGVMTKRTARKMSRIVNAESRHFFYNPMWRFFGERPDSPPGTYYYEASGKHIAYHWHIFDQVLVRPDLVDMLTDVRIVDRVGTRSLLDTNGKPDTRIGSDHLPLFFVIEW